MATVHTTAQELIQQAQSAYQAQQYPLAAEKFEAASASLAGDGDVLLAAEMANNRSVALLKAGNATAAFRAAQGTEQVFAQAGDQRRQAIALCNQASALESMDQSNQALDLYRIAADLLKLTNENELRAVVLKSMSLLQFRRRKMFDAMATMRAALDLQKHLSLRERLLKSLLNIVFRLLGG